MLLLELVDDELLHGGKRGALESEQTLGTRLDDEVFRTRPHPCLEMKVDLTRRFYNFACERKSWQMRLGAVSSPILSQSQK